MTDNARRPSRGSGGPITAARLRRASARRRIARCCPRAVSEATSACRIVCLCRCAASSASLWARSASARCCALAKSSVELMLGRNSPLMAAYLSRLASSACSVACSAACSAADSEKLKRCTYTPSSWSRSCNSWTTARCSSAWPRSCSACLCFAWRSFSCNRKSSSVNAFSSSLAALAAALVAHLNCPAFAVAVPAARSRSRMCGLSTPVINRTLTANSSNFLVCSAQPSQSSSVKRWDSTSASASFSVLIRSSWTSPRTCDSIVASDEACLRSSSATSSFACTSSVSGLLHGAFVCVFTCLVLRSLSPVRPQAGQAFSSMASGGVVPSGRLQSGGARSALCARPKAAASAE
mmetsp:Transcript_8727/g.16533  ORF Transcript_8727/g.16533 Transcript_8727/m.16533 type:complete len:352 (-) Transcript_8727:574-1629(-)